MVVGTINRGQGGVRGGGYCQWYVFLEGGDAKKTKGKGEIRKTPFLQGTACRKNVVTVRAKKKELQARKLTKKGFHPRAGRSDDANKTEQRRQGKKSAKLTRR